MSLYPESFEKFASSLQDLGVKEFKNFDENLAQMLRIQAGTKDYGAIMTSGVSALPYVPWLIDGMAMSNKLIVHLNETENALNEITQKLMETDIRITSHCQDQKEFTTDISEHRMDLLLLSDEALPAIDNWMKLLSDTGLLVFVSTAETRRELMQKYSNDYFCYDKEYLFISRKGAQHNKVRRRSKRRKAIKSAGV